MANWYELNKPDQVDSPALLVYKARVEQNINFMIRTVSGDSTRLVPHVKTHKMGEIVKMQLEAGISKFKCATISEAEMLAEAGAKWVLVAYQLVGPKIDRLLALAAAYPDVQFGVLIDNRAVAKYMNDRCKGKKISLLIFLDVNMGMNRTGHPINSELLLLYDYIYRLPNLLLAGLHCYDGHIGDQFFKDRKTKSDAAFEPLNELFHFVEVNGLPDPVIIAGGSPTFTVHARRREFLCSPGTCVLWDYGYSDRYKEQPFQHAAVLLTRVISKPVPGLITVDLGHKAVAAENPIDRRLRFLNLKEYTLISQSEEHSVLQVDNWNDILIGDTLYALPYHICPTVALHASAVIVEDGEVTDEWKVSARDRRITY